MTDLVPKRTGGGVVNDLRKELAAIKGDCQEIVRLGQLGRSQAVVINSAVLIEKLYDLATRAVEATEWRPIESAPKDGTIVDLWMGGKAQKRFPGCAYQSRALQDTNRKPGEDKPLGAWVGVGGEIVQSDNYGGCAYPITHWMPPPQPPADTKESSAMTTNTDDELARIEREYNQSVPMRDMTPSWDIAVGRLLKIASHLQETALQLKQERDAAREEVRRLQSRLNSAMEF